MVRDFGDGLRQIRNSCSAGLYDIGGLAKYFDYAVVFSEYSKKVLINRGWEERLIYQLPIKVRFDNFGQEHDQDIVNRYSDEYTNIIFTGRVFPNKKQEDLIYALERYKSEYNTKSRLIIVGSIGNRRYYAALKELSKDLKIEKDVIFTGRAPFAQYLAYYRVADIFLCMSAHEGFCIPLVEALYFHLPIIAINETAVPDTLSGSGVLIDDRNPDVIAKAINKIVTDEIYREKILAGEDKRLKELQSDELEEKYIEIISKFVSEKEPQKGYKDASNQFTIPEGIFVPQEIREKRNILYGFGASGHKLYQKLKASNVEISAICDKSKVGINEYGETIISIEEVVKKYADQNIIISIQNKGIIKEVVYSMAKMGIEIGKIFIYDEGKDEII